MLFASFYHFTILSGLLCAKWNVIHNHLTRRSDLRFGRLQRAHAHVLCGALLPGQEPVGDDHGDEQAAVGRQRRFFGRQGKVDHRICVIGISD